MKSSNNDLTFSLVTRSTLVNQIRQFRMRFALGSERAYHRASSVACGGVGRRISGSQMWLPSAQGGWHARFDESEAMVATFVECEIGRKRDWKNAKLTAFDSFHLACRGGSKFGHQKRFPFASAFHLACPSLSTQDPQQHRRITGDPR